MRSCSLALAISCALVKSYNSHALAATAGGGGASANASAGNRNRRTSRRIGVMRAAQISKLYQSQYALTGSFASE